MRAESLRERRQRLGLTQADLARRAGTSQSAVAAYESGAKVPSSATQQRLDRCLSPLPRQVLADHRNAVIDLPAGHRAKAVRVFGSVARGEDTFDSDIDLLSTSTGMLHFSTSAGSKPTSKNYCRPIESMWSVPVGCCHATNISERRHGRFDELA